MCLQNNWKEREIELHRVIQPKKTTSEAIMSTESRNRISQDDMEIENSLHLRLANLSVS